MKTLIYTINILLVLSTLRVNAQNQGYDIAKKSYDLDKGFHNYSADIAMTLSNKKGKSITRNLSMKVLEVEKDGNKSLMEFQNPADVKGTKVLTFSHGVADNDQWLYLPALARVKRISATAKSGSFLGSEFAFEDFASTELEKYDFLFVKEAMYKNTSVYVIERFPKDKHSGYLKQVVFYNKENYQVMKINYFDRKGQHVKTLLFLDYKKFNIGISRPLKLIMNNAKNGKSTELKYENFNFQDSNIRNADFSPTGIKGN